MPLPSHHEDTYTASRTGEKQNSNPNERGRKGGRLLAGKVTPHVVGLGAYD